MNVNETYFPSERRSENEDDVMLMWRPHQYRWWRVLGHRVNAPNAVAVFAVFVVVGRRGPSLHPTILLLSLPPALTSLP